MPRLLLDLFQKAYEAYRSNYYHDNDKSKKLKDIFDSYQTDEKKSEDDLANEINELAKDDEFKKVDSRSANHIKIMLEACQARLTPESFPETIQAITALSESASADTHAKYKAFVDAAKTYVNNLAVANIHELKENLALQEQMTASALQDRMREEQAFERAVKQAETHASQLASYKTQAREKLAKKQNDIYLLETRISELAQQLKTAHLESAEKSQKIAQLNNTLNISAGQLKMTTTKITDLAAELSDVKTQLGEIRTQHQEYVATFNLAEMEARFNLLSISEKSKDAEIQNLKSALQALQNRLNSEVASHAADENKTRNLVKTLESIVKEREKLVCQLQSVATEKERLTMEKHALVEAKNNLSNQLANKDKELYQLQDSLTELKNRLAELRTQYHIVCHERLELSVLLEKANFGPTVNPKNIPKTTSHNFIESLLQDGLAPLLNYSIFGPPSDEIRKQPKTVQTLTINVTPPSPRM